MDPNDPNPHQSNLVYVMQTGFTSTSSSGSIIKFIVNGMTPGAGQTQWANGTNASYVPPFQGSPPKPVEKKFVATPPNTFERSAGWLALTYANVALFLAVGSIFLGSWTGMGGVLAFAGASGLSEYHRRRLESQRKADDVRSAIKG